MSHFNASQCTFNHVGRDQTTIHNYNILVISPSRSPRSRHRIHVNVADTRPPATYSSNTSQQGGLVPYPSPSAVAIISITVGLIEEISELLMNDHRRLSVGDRDLALELELLQRTLTLTRLAIQMYENKPLGQSLANTIAPEVLRCFFLLREFFDSIEGSWLDLSITSVAGFWRRIWRVWWDGDKFTVSRQQLSDSRQALQGLVMALRSVAWMELGNELCAGFVSLQRFHDSFTQRLPSLHHIKLEAVDLVNHLGYNIPIPTMFCARWEDFNYIVQIHCRDRMGNAFIERGDYEVIGAEDNRLISKSEFANQVAPGMKLEMSIVMRQGIADHKQCPRCRYINSQVADRSGWIECRKCSGQFQITGANRNNRREESHPGEHGGNVDEERVRNDNVESEDEEIVSPASGATETSGIVTQQWVGDEGIYNDGKHDDNDKKFFRRIHVIGIMNAVMNWRYAGRLLRKHCLPCLQSPIPNPSSTSTNLHLSSVDTHPCSSHPSALGDGVITSVALDSDWLVVGLANSHIHVFSAKTGILARTLVGHEEGVWEVCLISHGGRWGGSGARAGRSVKKGKGLENNGEKGWADGDGVEDGVEALNGALPGVGLSHLLPPSIRTALGLDVKLPLTPQGPTSSRAHRQHGTVHQQAETQPGMKAKEDHDEETEEEEDPGKRSDECCTTEGWGQPNALVVSGGCDKVLRVWDVKSGYCIYILRGHTSTIRCIKLLHYRPIAITGSRDSTLRVWDVQRGRIVHVLRGHQGSIRCLDVCGRRVVSGSYDCTLRLWNVDTGECIHVMQGHFNQIYSVAFDGVRIASGGLDVTIHVWDASTGQCIALLQGHTSLVCQLQLGPGPILATGGSDGHVIIFSLSSYTALNRLTAHDSSITSLQLYTNFLMTSGNDGRVRLWETKGGGYVRELTERCESVWKVVCRGDVCAIMCRRERRSVIEIWSYGLRENM